MDSQNEKISEKPGFFRWKPAAWLRVTGEDAFTFLQGQFTNDLRSLQANGAVYGLWLNHKGRVLADSFILPGGPGEYWVGSYYCAAKTIQERLEAFIIADDVVIEDQTAGWAGITLLGRETASAGPGSPGFLFQGRRTGRPHQERVARVDDSDRMLTEFEGAEERSESEMERLRIADEIARIPADIGPGELPNEGRLDEVAISYSKGCYLGQEVMARLKTMGQVRRRLLRVKGAGALPSLPSAIFVGEKRIGELRTAVETSDGFIGLALLSLLNLTSTTALSFSPDVRATVGLVSTL